MNDQYKIWNYIYWMSLGWLAVIAVMMMYDSYLMWFEASRLEFFQPNHTLKTAILTFPMLGLSCVAWLLKKKNRDKEVYLSSVIYFIGISILGLPYYKLRANLDLDNGLLFLGTAILYLAVLWPISNFVSKKWFSRK